MFFIMSYLIAGVFTGFFLESIKNVIAFYFVSYVAYESTKILIGKYNGMEFLCNVILSFGLIDAFVSIWLKFFANTTSKFSRYPFAQIKVLNGFFIFISVN